MSGIWWGKEASFEVPPSQPAESADATQPPELTQASRSAVISELLGRAGGYTPDWTRRSPSDAGIALVRLFGEQMEPVLSRLNRLPEKALVEFLDMAGVEPLPAIPAEALLEFEVADSAPQPVLVGTGFQVGASPAQGGDMVIFETQQAIYAAPAQVAELHVKQGNRFQALDFMGSAPFLPFGQDAVPGRAFFIGLAGKVVPGPVLSLGIRVAAPPGRPPPASAGGLTPLPIPSPPTLRWHVLDGGSFQPVNVVSDETGGLFRSGVVQVELPRQWRAGRPDGMDAGPPLRWLRVSIAHGKYSEPPSLLFLKLNMVLAQATHTVRNEVLEPVAGSGGSRWRLSQTPVLPGSLQLTIDEGASDLTLQPPALTAQRSAQTQSMPLLWQAVADLSDYRPDDRVYVLDPLTGEVAFGDNVHGKAAPQGFRHIQADSYKAGGGQAGAVDAESITTLLSSVTFLKSAKNPLPATGGIDQESQEKARTRGPQEIRARGRAVTGADYALLAKRVPGANIQRAHAVAGFHPIYPGKPIPGVVGVFIIPPDRGEGPPTPDERTLNAVAEFLSRQAAPAGVDVVVAAPLYQKIRAEIGLIIERDADMAETARRVTAGLNRYLNPLLGGDQGDGWPFGGTLRYAVLLRLISGIDGVHAVPRLNLVLDDVRIPSCRDVPTAPHALLWPETSEIIMLGTAGES